MNKYVDNPSRTAPISSLVVGLVFLTVNHLFIDKIGYGAKLLVLLGSLFVSLGIGGLVDPRFFTGVMNEAKGVYPTWIRAVSISLVVLGFAVGILLLVFVYKVFP